MKNIINDLYMSALEDIDNKLMDKQQYRDTLACSDNIDEKLKNMLNSREGDLFQKHYTTIMKLSHQERLQSFESGFILGISMMTYSLGKGMTTYAFCEEMFNEEES